METEGLLDYQRRAGIISIVLWNLRPVIFGVESQKGERKQEDNSRLPSCNLALSHIRPCFFVLASLPRALTSQTKQDMTNHYDKVGAIGPKGKYGIEKANGVQDLSTIERRFEPISWASILGQCQIPCVQKCARREG